MCRKVTSGKGQSELFGPAAEQERAVGSAEAEGIGQGILEGGFAGVVGDEVHTSGVRILIFQIDGGGQNLVLEGEDGDAGFEASGAAEKMAGHGFGGADGDFSLAKEIANGLGFEGVADGS